MNDNFGMMDEGYFVPRKEIIEWINKLLKVNLYYIIISYNFNGKFKLKINLVKY